MNIIRLRRASTALLAVLCFVLLSTHAVATSATLPQPQVHTSSSRVLTKWHLQELRAPDSPSAPEPPVRPPAPVPPGKSPVLGGLLPAPKTPDKPTVPVPPARTPTPEPTADVPESPTPTEPAATATPTEPAPTVTPTERAPTVAPTEPAPTATPTEVRASAPTEAPAPQPTPTVAEAEVVELLVKFEAGSGVEMLAHTESVMDVQVVGAIPQLGVQRIRVTSSALSTLETIRRLPGVVYAEPNYSVHLLELPGDPDVSLQWHLEAIAAPDAWDVATGDGVTIAIVDTGVDPRERDLKDKLVNGYDYVNQDAEPWDDQGHGTRVALIAAAAANNGYGGAGVAYDARVMPVKALNDSGSGTHEWLSKAIIWAADNSADVVNLSAGGPYPSQTLQDAVNYASRRGVLLVAAAGNESSNVPAYPAAYDSVLAVSGTTRDQQRAGFSNWGDHVSVAAPGTGILVTSGGGRLSGSGTSLAAPQVSGVAALVLSRNPDLSADQVRDIVQSAASDLGSPGWDPFYGFGQVNAQQAVLYAQSEPGGPNPTDALIEAVNDARRERGLSVLRPHAGLMTSAQHRADELTARCGASGDPGLASCVTRPHQASRRFEAIFVGVASPEAVVRLLAASGAGQDLLFGSYQQIGVGYVETGGRAVSQVWVLRFARVQIVPRVVPPRPIPPGME